MSARVHRSGSQFGAPQSPIDYTNMQPRLNPDASCLYRTGKPARCEWVNDTKKIKSSECGITEESDGQFYCNNFNEKNTTSRSAIQNRRVFHKRHPETLTPRASLSNIQEAVHGDDDDVDLDVDVGIDRDRDQGRAGASSSSRSGDGGRRRVSDQQQLLDEQQERERQASSRRTVQGQRETLVHTFSKPLGRFKKDSTAQWDLSANTSARSSDTSDVDARVAHWEKNKAELRLMSQDLTERLAECRTESQEIAAEKDRVDAEIVELQRAIAEMNAAIAQATALTEQLRAFIQQKEAERAAAAAAAGEAGSHRQQNRAELDRIKAERDDVVQQLRQLQADLQACLAAKVAAQADLDALKNQRVQLDTSSTALRQHGERINAEKELLLERAQALGWTAGMGA